MNLNNQSYATDAYVYFIVSRYLITSSQVHSRYGQLQAALAMQFSALNAAPLQPDAILTSAAAGPGMGIRSAVLRNIMMITKSYKCT